jgi:hypothetical protein
VVRGARRLTELDHRRPDGTLFAVILAVPGLAGHLELRLDPPTAEALNGYDFLTLAIADRSALNNWVGQFLNLLFAVLGTDLGTERGEFGANKRDVVKQAGRRNAVDQNA